MSRLQYERGQHKFKQAAKQSARAELLLPEETGFLEFDADEDPSQITQADIANNVDIASAQKVRSTDCYVLE